jgi:CheY-like chemotaxis protein/two-component sensor histidine kinase
MEAVGRLAGGVAHDFNNLLTVISGNVELAREELEPDTSLAQTLTDVAKAADSAAMLTRQLLAFSRRQIIEPRNVDLNELVENLRKMLGRLVGEDITLVVKLRDGLGAVKVDPSQFEQVVVNLVVNGRDATGSGGRIVIETDNVELDENSCQRRTNLVPGPYVMLAVSDTGHGMTEAVKRRIFEPFFTTKERGRGTGLGLAMIFGAVQQAHGTIEVYSEVELGTTFKIYLPRTDAPADALTSPSVELELAKENETVLLVEDEESVRSIAATMLSKLGYRVLVASNGKDALLLAREHTHRIDALITDIVMPGMNGRELAEQLGVYHPEARVLYASGYTEDVMIHHGVNQENVRFVGKPYSMRALASKLRQTLDARTLVPPKP